MSMEFLTDIDASVLAEALSSQLEEDAAAHKHGFTLADAREGGATVTVYEAMHPERSLLADISWSAQDVGSRVEISYRAPQEGTVEKGSFLAPIAAYITMMILVGGIMWGAGFGLLFLMLGENRGSAWLFAMIAPAVYLTGVVVNSLTARFRTRRRFERLMRDMFTRNDQA